MQWQYNGGLEFWAVSLPADSRYARAYDGTIKAAKLTQDPSLVADHPPRLRPPGRTWDRGGFNAYSSPMHKTETVDYGILLAGERVLVLDDRELVMKPGDVCVQVGAWHKWTSFGPGSLMAFDMFAAKFVDGAAGLAQGNDKVMRADPAMKLPEGIKPARCIVTIDREPGGGVLVGDGPTPDMRFDLARPGFASARLWVNQPRGRRNRVTCGLGVLQFVFAPVELMSLSYLS